MAGTRICDICEEEISTKGIAAHIRGHKAKPRGLTVTADPKNPNSVVLSRWPTNDEEKAEVKRQIEGG